MKTKQNNILSHTPMKMGRERSGRRGRGKGQIWLKSPVCQSLLQSTHQSENTLAMQPFCRTQQDVGRAAVCAPYEVLSENISVSYQWPRPHLSAVGQQQTPGVFSPQKVCYSLTSHQDAIHKTEGKRELAISN